MQAGTENATKYYVLLTRGRLSTYTSIAGGASKMVWSSSTPARKATLSFIDGSPPVRNRVVPQVGQKWLLISCPRVSETISMQRHDLFGYVHDTYIPMVRLLRVHLRHPLGHGEILLRNLVYCKIVDLAIIMAVANRLANIRRVSNVTEKLSKSIVL